MGNRGALGAGNGKRTTWPRAGYAMGACQAQVHTSARSMALGLPLAHRVCAGSGSFNPAQAQCVRPGCPTTSHVTFGGVVPANAQLEVRAPHRVEIVENRHQYHNIFRESIPVRGGTRLDFVGSGQRPSAQPTASITGRPGCFAGLCLVVNQVPHSTAAAAGSAGSACSEKRATRPRLRSLARVRHQPRTS